MTYQFVVLFVNDGEVGQSEGAEKETRCFVEAHWKLLVESSFKATLAILLFVKFGKLGCFRYPTGVHYCIM